MKVKNHYFHNHPLFRAQVPGVPAVTAACQGTSWSPVNCLHSYRSVNHAFVAKFFVVPFIRQISLRISKRPGAGIWKSWCKWGVVSQADTACPQGHMGWRPFPWLLSRLGLWPAVSSNRQFSRRAEEQAHLPRMFWCESVQRHPHPSGGPQRPLRGGGLW